MNMIWHYDPCQQLIALVVKITQCSFSQGRNLWPTEPALAVTPVEVFFQSNSALPVVFNPQEGLPLAMAHLGKPVLEPESYKLNQPRRIPMRQIAALMPTTKALLAGMFADWLSPSLLALYQLVQTRIVRRPTKIAGALTCSRLTISTCGRGSGLLSA